MCCCLWVHCETRDPGRDLPARTQLTQQLHLCPSEGPAGCLGTIPLFPAVLFLIPQVPSMLTFPSPRPTKEEGASGCLPSPGPGQESAGSGWGGEGCREQVWRTGHGRAHSGEGLGLELRGEETLARWAPLGAHGAAANQALTYHDESFEVSGLCVTVILFTCAVSRGKLCKYTQSR